MEYAKIAILKLIHGRASRLGVPALMTTMDLTVDMDQVTRWLPMMMALVAAQILPIVVAVAEARILPVTQQS